MKYSQYSQYFDEDWKTIEPIAEHVGALLYALNMADADNRINKRIRSEIAGKPFETVLKAWREIVLIQFHGVKAGNYIDWGSESVGDNFSGDLKRDVWLAMQDL